MSYILKWLSSLYEILNLTRLSFERYLKGYADRQTGRKVDKRMTARKPASQM